MSYCSIFHKSVTLYTDFLQQSDDPSDLKIAVVDARGGVDGSGEGGVTDWLYSREEYAKLSNAQKNKIRKLRLERKGGDPKGDKGKSDGGSDGVPKMCKKLKQHARQISALNVKLKKSKADHSSDSDSVSSKGSEGKGTSNRKHSALTRQKKKMSRFVRVKSATRGGCGGRCTH